MKKTKYIIYTENTPQLRRILDVYIPGYTILIGEGRWNEQTEQAAIVIYIADVPNIIKMRYLVERILVDCKQSSVYLETQEIKLTEFTRKEK